MHSFRFENLVLGEKKNTPSRKRASFPFAMRRAIEKLNDTEIG
jgi:hypothetical protein